MLYSAPIQSRWITGQRGFGVARPSQHVGYRVDALPQAKRGDLQDCHQVHMDPTCRCLLSPPPIINHIPDLEESLHRFWGIEPIFLGDINHDLDAV